MSEHTNDVLTDLRAMEQGHLLTLLQRSKHWPDEDRQALYRYEARRTALLANEREIANDLLAALRGIVGEWEAERLEWFENRDEVLSLRVKQPNTGSTFIDAARAAIAKAEGRDT